MKKLVLILSCCLLLTGCGNPGTETTGAPTESPTTAPVVTTVPETTTAPETSIPVTLFLPDENAEHFVTAGTVVDALDAQYITDELIKAGVLNQAIRVNKAELAGTQLNLDFSSEFLTQLCTYGTAGERMMIGSVVNTFLSVYEAETVFITVDDQIMESGHVIYDFPLSFFE